MKMVISFVPVGAMHIQSHGSSSLSYPQEVKLEVVFSWLSRRIKERSALRTSRHEESQRTASAQRSTETCESAPCVMSKSSRAEVCAMVLQLISDEQPCMPQTHASTRDLINAKRHVYVESVLPAVHYQCFILSVVFLGILMFLPTRAVGVLAQTILCLLVAMRWLCSVRSFVTTLSTMRVGSPSPKIRESLPVGALQGNHKHLHCKVLVNWYVEARRTTSPKCLLFFILFFSTA